MRGYGDSRGSGRAVGVNIEDSPDGSGSYTPTEQADRWPPPREADHQAFPFWRSPLAPTCSYTARGSMTISKRSAVYAAGGARGQRLFVPGAKPWSTRGDRRAGRGTAAGRGMVGQATPSVAEIAAAGRGRISIGSAIAQAAYAVAVRGPPSCLNSGN